MDAVFERGRKKIGTIVKKRRQQQHGILNVGDCVGASVLERQYPAGLLGGEWCVGNGEQERPSAFGFDLDYLRLNLIRHTSNGDSAHPAGRRVVRMMLTHRGFAYNAI